MRSFGAAKRETSGLAHKFAFRRYLAIPAADDIAHVHPRVVVERPIIVTAQETMQIDIKEFIARDDPPAFKVDIAGLADDEIRWAASH